MIRPSTSELSFATIPAGRPARACSISSSMSSASRSRRFRGETASFSNRSGGAVLVM